MTNTNIPWNKGRTGLAAGWTKARRKLASDKQKKWLKDNPKNIFARKGPQPKIWKTGPDKAIHKHYYRFLRAKAHARLWQQDWTITWEDYLDLYKTMLGKWSRATKHKNLTRIDTREGWHIWNVRLMTRLTAMRRSTKGRKRIRPAGLGAKKKGIVWKRGGTGQ